MTQDDLKEILHYDPITGIFRWLTEASARIKVGDEAGSYDKDGYKTFMYKGKNYGLHRMAYLYMTGSTPRIVDHKNNIKDDNRWSNLREASKAENAYNSITPKSNTSGVKGVSWYKRDKKWKARITRNGNDYHLGYFTNIEDAESAVRKARIRLHGEYANHG